jgi:valyl-tRNA synthetase
MTNSLDSKVNSKDDSNKNSSAYLPVEVEKRWTEYWHENKLFDLDVHPDKPRFSIALPPPNITGNLHMGHALNGTLQDVLIRLKRMQGLQCALAAWHRSCWHFHPDGG